MAYNLYRDTSLLYSLWRVSNHISSGLNVRLTILTIWDLRSTSPAASGFTEPISQSPTTLETYCRCPSLRMNSRRYPPTASFISTLTMDQGCKGCLSSIEFSKMERTCVCLISQDTGTLKESTSRWALTRSSTSTI